MLLMAKGIQKGFIFLKPCAPIQLQFRSCAPDLPGSLAAAAISSAGKAACHQESTFRSWILVMLRQQMADLVGEVLYSSGEGVHAAHGSAHEHTTAAGVQI